MNTVTVTKKRSKPPQYTSDNQIEALRGIPGGAVKSLASLAKDTVSLDQWKTYLGLGSQEKPQEKLSGDLSEGQELNLKGLNKRKEKERILDIDPGINYRDEILNREKRVSHRMLSETQSKIEQILDELKKIVATTKELQVQFREVAVEQITVKPGRYHESFFEWMLSIVRSARAKVEDSGAWLSAAKGKHAKKGMYWTNADEKVGGTSFSLSSERVVATQTG